MQKISFIAIGTLLAPVFISPALGISISGVTQNTNVDGAQLNNTSPLNVLGVIQGEAGVGTVNGGLNQGTGNSGFNNFFTSNFGRLGSNDSSSLSPPSLGISSLSTNSFRFSNTNDLLSFPTVAFDYAFNGSTGILGFINNTTNLNTFSVYFALASAPAVPVLLVFTTNTFAPQGTRVSVSGLVPASSLLNSIDNYVLTFQLNEVAPALVFGNNSAAGVDGVSITNANTTPVPFEFSPGLGILALGIWGAIAQFKRQVQKCKFPGSAFSNK